MNCLVPGIGVPGTYNAVRVTLQNTNESRIETERFLPRILTQQNETSRKKYEIYFLQPQKCK